MNTEVECRDNTSQGTFIGSEGFEKVCKERDREEEMENEKGKERREKEKVRAEAWKLRERVSPNGFAV